MKLPDEGSELNFTQPVKLKLPLVTGAFAERYWEDAATKVPALLNLPDVNVAVL
jgi:hypothetical protein